MSFVAGMLVGMLVVAVAVEIIVWGRQQEARHWQATPIKAASRTRDMHAEYIAAYQQAPPAMTIEERQAKFAPEPKPIIDMNRIVQIESSGNANSVGTSGERGLCQIMPKTWKQVTREMGVDWTFDEAWDPVKNLAVGTHYMTVTIPRYLRSIDMPDTASARAVCYNWGFGNLRRAWHEHGGAWLSNIPDVRQDYYRRYTQAEPAHDYVRQQEGGEHGN
jgi:hypothetical protein